MKTHIIENGVVTNTIVATVEEAQAAFPSATCIEATEGGIGWTYDGSTFTPPVIDPIEPQQFIPTVVSSRQGKLALLDAGLLDDVEAAVAASSRAVQIEWIEATEFRRDWPTLVALQGTLGLTDQQIDDLFIAASRL